MFPNRDNRKSLLSFQYEPDGTKTIQSLVTTPSRSRDREFAERSERPQFDKPGAAA
jgi:hypothetical protein